ncbi:MAG TPA: hypothetical protein VHP11_14990 [Tepidisphaeraceae bacterium]|nr:hypothetical protein [Tepidisphaeraceae bacterium]
MLTRLEIILALFGAVAGLALLAQKVKVPYGILLVTIQFLLNGWVFILIGLELPDNQETM